MQPEILVLDEPTAGLDPQGAKEMMDLFKQLHENGTTIILVTHDMNHVLNYCDHAIVMSKGTILKTGTVEDIFKEVDVLSSLSIELPLITQLIYSLNEKGFNLPLNILLVIEIASLPLNLIIEIAPFIIAVEIATIVSFILLIQVSFEFPEKEKAIF